MKSGSPSRMTAAHKTQTETQAWSSLVFHCCHSSFNPSEAPPWDSRLVSGAGVVHYQLLHRPRSVPTALGPAPLATVPFSSQTVLLFLWHLTTGSSLRRERRRKLCRSPYFMKGSTTIGLGKRSETTSKQTPV